MLALLCFQCRYRFSVNKHLYIIDMGDSAHRGKWGQLIPAGKIDEKLKKRTHAEKEQFSMFTLYFESNQGRKV